MEEQQQATSSVSKGCFLFNAHSRKKQPVLTGSFKRLPGEREGDARHRHKAYTSCWATVKDKIDAIMSRQHDRIFADILQFIHSVARQLEALHERSRAAVREDSPAPGGAPRQARLLPPRLEIPTAALVAGVNMPDHGVLFSQLRETVRREISPHAVLLKSKDCNTGMKSTMQEILKQLMLGEQQLSPSEDSDDEAPPTSSSHPRLPLCSMPILCSWYRETCQQTIQAAAAEPSRKKHKLDPVDEDGGNRTRWPPVLVIVEDFEGFVPQILQDLIASFSPHLPNFPVVLIFGVATTVGVVTRTLPRPASSLLSIEQFHTEHPALTLAHIVREVLLTPSLPFRLGPRAFQFLLHQFFSCNFSITSFTKAIQCAMMEHFYWQPLSVLMCSSEGSGSGGKEGVASLTHLQCEMVRATPSFQRHVESLAPEKQLSLLENDSALKAEVKELLSLLGSYHRVFFPLLECLSHLTRALPGAPLGRKLHELYALCLEQKITEHAKFDSSWTLLGVLGRSDLSSILAQCVGVLENPVAEYRNRCPSPLSDTLAALKRFLHDLKQLDQQPTEGSGQEGSSELSALPAADETTGERKMRFQERLRQLAARKKEPTEYEKLRSRVLDLLFDLFQTHLVCPHTLPLHELYYFNQFSSLRKHLAAAPRAAIQTALSRPDYYLPSASGVTERTRLDANMPDVCIAYQLHLECGRLINLYDWLQAFVAVIRPEEAGSREEAEEESGSKGKSAKGSKQEVDPVIHAHFIQAVSELQFLGFIKPTRRKTDHVQRLTWGAC